MGINTLKAAPPRHLVLSSAATSSESTTAKLKALGTQARESKPESSSESEGSGLGTIGTFREAASVMTPQNGLLAGKALAIATALVGLGGFGLAWGVKVVFGVDDVRFATASHDPKPYRSLTTIGTTVRC